MQAPVSPVPPFPPELPLDASSAVWVLPILFIVAFLLGSIPWGVVISKVFFHKDIRRFGSGNIGTTNAMRTMGKAGGIAVFLLDFGKGLLSGYLGFVAANAFGSADPLLHSLPLAVAFLGCIWGHIFSPWLKFKGGKGIAVAVGALFFLYGPIGTLIEIAIFAILTIVTRYVSVGSLAAAVVCPFMAVYIYFGNWPVVLICTVAAATVIWAHRGNISRLRKGEENRIGSKKEVVS